jgi:hypothetical protein
MGVTQVAVGYTALPSRHETGIFLGKDVLDKLKGAVPDAVIVFASSEYSYEALLTAIDETCGPA